MEIEKNANKKDVVNTTQNNEEKLEKSANGEKDEKDEKKEGKAPVGNGGATDKYTWTQTLEEVQHFIINYPKFFK